MTRPGAGRRLGLQGGGEHPDGRVAGTWNSEAVSPLTPAPCPEGVPVCAPWSPAGTDAALPQSGVCCSGPMFPARPPAGIFFKTRFVYSEAQFAPPLSSQQNASGTEAGVLSGSLPAMAKSRDIFSGSVSVSEASVRPSGPRNLGETRGCRKGLGAWMQVLPLPPSGWVTWTFPSRLLSFPHQ